LENSSLNKILNLDDFQIYWESENQRGESKNEFLRKVIRTKKEKSEKNSPSLIFLSCSMKYTQNSENQVSLEEMCCGN
jgi:hypothetical protein